METPPEIQFQGMQGTPEIEKTIAAHIAELDERFGRITACRVVVKAPSQHHHEGGLYEVHIRLLLPEGHEVKKEGFSYEYHYRAKDGRALTDFKITNCE
jgi:hypothetical protein